MVPAELCHFAELTILVFALGQGRRLRFKHHLIIFLTLGQEGLRWDLDVNLITAIVNSDHLLRLIAILVGLSLLCWRGFYHLRGKVVRKSIHILRTILIQTNC